MLSDGQMMNWWLDKVIEEHEKNIVRDYQELKGKYLNLKEEKHELDKRLSAINEDTKEIIHSLSEAENREATKQNKLNSILNLIDGDLSELAISIREIIERNGD